MKRKRRKEDPAAAPASGAMREGRQRNLMSYLIRGPFVALLAFVLASVLYFLLDRQQAAAEHEREAAAAAGALARHLGDLIMAKQQVMAALVRRPELLELMRSGDAAARRRGARQFAPLFGAGSQVRLLPLGLDRTDNDPDLPIGFAVLDMVRRVTEESVPPAEVQKAPAGNRVLLAGALRDPDDRAIAGVLLAAWPASILEGMLEPYAADLGRFELQQIVEEGHLTVAVNPDAPVVRGAAVGSEPVPGSIWQVAYWPAATPLIGGNRPLVLALFLGIPVLSLLATWVAAGALRRDLHEDMHALRRIVSDLVSGQATRPPVAHLADCQPMLEQLAALSTSADKARRTDMFAAASEQKPAPEEEKATAESAPQLLPESIFRAYDIRGVVGETLTARMVRTLGQAIGSVATEKGEDTVVVARDGRLSSAEFALALREGLQAAGCHVVDIGLAPTPVMYFATHYLSARSGVVVTGSHNPPEYNGLKIVIAGESLASEEIMALRERIAVGWLAEGRGSGESQDLVPDYIQRIVDDVAPPRTLRVVLDCGNGAAGAVAPALFAALGCEVIERFCEVDGNFPGHHPDPSRPENLQDLIQTVRAQQADIGLAFDGDGDRLGVVDGEGRIIWPDRLLMLLSSDVLARQPGSDIVFDVKSSRLLAGHVLASGGRPVMWKTGHSLLKAKLRETGALLAGEFSGHIIFKERWYGFDDALYAGARLLEVLAADPRTPAEVFADLPDSVSTPEIHLPMVEGEPESAMEQIRAVARFPDAKLVTTDGLRIEFSEGWGLVRASNTMPDLVFRFEADDEAGLATVQAHFRSLFDAALPGLKLPF